MKKILFAAALCLSMFAATAFAGEPQLYTKETLKTWNRDNVAGGQGTLYG